MPAFCFLVYGSHTFDTVNWLRHALAGLGTKDAGYFYCQGEARYLGHLMEGYLFSPDHPSPDDLERATAFGIDVAQRAGEGRYLPITDEPKAPLIYQIERVTTSRWLVEQVYSRLFRVNHDRCTACGICMETCPTKNMEKDEREHPRCGRHCLFCLSCEMNCPEDAISSAISRPGLSTLAHPFLRYNVSHWVRESELDHIRVVHRHGRTERQ